MSSNNDSVVRVFDCEVFSVLSKFEYKWPVNVSASPTLFFLAYMGQLLLATDSSLFFIFINFFTDSSLNQQ